METRLELGAYQTRSLAMTSRLRQAIGLLRLGNQQLSDHLASFAAVNPHLVLAAAPRPALARNWLDQFLAAPPAGAAGPAPAPISGGSSSSGADAAERAAAPEPGLVEHVMAQLGLLVRDPADRPLALAFVAVLEPSGWLGARVAEVARGCGVPQARAEKVLAELQQAEPAGLFARSLAECLRLQAQDRGLLAADFAALLDNLPLLARGDQAALAARCGCSAERLAEMLRALRAMNPKPGAGFSDAPPPITEPDLIVRRERGRWMVELNRSTLPAIELREAPEGGSDELLRDARWMARAVARRNTTTLRIAREVLLRQAGFLADGPERLVPLTAAEIAQATGLHPSTISRVTAGLLLATPRATLRFRDFFSAALAARGDAAPVATQRVLHQMQALIAAEDRTRPLSDDDIARHFQARGVVLARRTVAKYRAALGIAGSAARRKR
ncbi:RNA polymerase factor sigma-54 [Phaeovulum sp.]|uniref:RNA polymerase factor sigma-54 n=1 Tax=Phaeovulum sp. TaxID=2934796 RepID=UPI00272F381A|nr:RNA polymerase factor sigma-54 [Phaeovulum sp.]MDP1669914.1 RNA polymerase factor sigma-54 [Phaeovulum sp.]MDZ4118626.1 RNA polymerase factor sigma-54 [Phaeovulum sp.]